MQLPAAVYHALQIIRLSKSLQWWEAFNFHTVLNLSEVQVYNGSAPVLSKLPSVEKKRVRDNSCERSTTMTHSGLIAFSFFTFDVYNIQLKPGTSYIKVINKHLVVQNGPSPLFFIIIYKPDSQPREQKDTELICLNKITVLQHNTTSV